MDGDYLQVHLWSSQKPKLQETGHGNNKAISSLWKESLVKIVFKLAGATMGRGLGKSEEDWKKWAILGCNTYMQGNNTRNPPG
jgi:hypothetical protein